MQYEKKKMYSGVKEAVKYIHLLLDLKKKKPIARQDADEIRAAIKHFDAGGLRSISQNYVIRYNRILSTDLKNRTTPEDFLFIASDFYEKGFPIAPK